MDAPAASLYDRLGGIYSIATVVDDFIDRIMVDDRLNANPRVDEAHHRVLPPGFKSLDKLYGTGDPALIGAIDLSRLSAAALAISERLATSNFFIDALFPSAVIDAALSVWLWQFQAKPRRTTPIAETLAKSSMPRR